MILDIHTHHPAPQKEGVIDASPISMPEFEPMQGQLYSAGIHPWDTIQPIPDGIWEKLEERLASDSFAAVGECGVDLSGNAGMLFVQLRVLKRQIEISENLGKPLIVHCVKAEDVICGLRRDLKPTQPWIIHGFRKKPEVAGQLLRAGCHISIGEHFNVETLKCIPDDRLLAETDQSPRSIDEIINSMEYATDRDLRSLIAANTASVLNKDILI